VEEPTIFRAEVRPSHVVCQTGAPFIEKMCGNVALSGPMWEIAAVVVGVILNLIVGSGCVCSSARR
jgi:hypothetical protein